MDSLDAGEIPSEFLRAWDFARQVLNPTRQPKIARLQVLAPSLRRAAEVIEDSEPYRHLLTILSSHGRPSPWKIREYVRRAGFYQAVQNSGSPEIVWRTLQAQLADRVATIRTLVLLDGCWFPQEELSVGGVSIRRLGEEQLRDLGPPLEVASAFFPMEVLDPDWYSRVWFLCRQDEREIKPTGIFVRFGYDIIGKFWEPILALAVYKTDYFALPIVLESDAKWRLDRVRWADPMASTVEAVNGDIVEVPRTDYGVDAEEKPRFDAFRKFFDDAIAITRDFKPFRLAARRYLRAVQIAGPHVASEDDYEDALLQHIFALEALLSAGDREALGDKLATRAAWLVGTSDRVRNEVFKTVKSLYGARSAVVHGGAAERNRQRSRALDEVRDLLRRVIVGLMALRRASSSNEECLRLLKTSAFDQSSQHAVAGATQPAWALIDPGFEYPESVWGLKYDRISFTG